MGFYFRKVRSEIRKLRPIKNFHTAQAQLFADYTGMELDKAKALLQELIYGEYIHSFKNVGLFPHVRETIEKIKSFGLRVGVLSDFPVKDKVSFLGLDDLWECIISSESTNYLKPNPEPFQAVADELKLGFEDILYVGNSYPYDVIGANSVGMQTAHLAKKSPKNTKADFTFWNYRDLAAWIEARLK